MIENKNWLSENMKDSEFRKEFNRKRVVEDFLNQLDEMMKIIGYSKRDLADRIGCTQGNVTQIMNGSRNLTINTMGDIANCLGLRLSITLIDDLESK